MAASYILDTEYWATYYWPVGFEYWPEAFWDKVDVALADSSTNPLSLADSSTNPLTLADSTVYNVTLSDVSRD